jgi:hypothetical protein
MQSIDKSKKRTSTNLPEYRLEDLGTDFKDILENFNTTASYEDYKFEKLNLEPQVLGCKVY